MKIIISLSSHTLRSKLIAAGVHDNVVTALESAVSAGINSKDPSARAYASAMETAYDEYGIDGVKHQVPYLLLNLGKWSGEEARIAKKVLKKWSK